MQETKEDHQPDSGLWKYEVGRELQVENDIENVVCGDNGGSSGGNRYSDFLNLRLMVVLNVLVSSSSELYFVSVSPSAYAILGSSLAAKAGGCGR
jgi:hypothetical protein